MATSGLCASRSDDKSPVEVLEQQIKENEATLAKQRLALEFVKANPGYVALLELGGRF